MLTAGPATRIYLMPGATDMRMGFDGLCALASGPMGLDPLCGHLFLFCNKGRNRLKVLFWDGTGLWSCAKRLEKGRFAWPDAGADNGKVSLTQAEMAMLLSGMDHRDTRKRAWLRIE